MRRLELEGKLVAVELHDLSTWGLARGMVSPVRSGEGNGRGGTAYAIVHVRYALCDIHKSLLVPGGSGFTQGAAWHDGNA